MKPAPVVFLALLLSACAGASTRFYTLQPAAPPSQSPLSYAGSPVRIDAVHIPASLDRPELVREQAGDRFIVSDNDHWAAPVGELLRRVLTQDLAALLPREAVIFPDAPKPPNAAGVVVDILSITPSSEGVVMQASWTLLPTKAAAASHQRAVRLTIPSAGAGVQGNAAELSALAGQLAAAIAQDLARPT
jgi:uncharacterized lipoprotein YmbA